MWVGAGSAWPLQRGSQDPLLPNWDRCRHDHQIITTLAVVAAALASPLRASHAAQLEPSDLETLTGGGGVSSLVSESIGTERWL